MVRISKSFIKSSFVYTFSGALPLASAVLLLPFYTKYLSVSDFGAFTVYLSFTLLVQVITVYSWDTSIYIHFHEFKNDKAKLNPFVSSAFVLMSMIGLTVAAILLQAGDFIFRHVFAEKSIAFFPYGFLAVGTGIFQALFKVYGSLLQSREKPVSFFWNNSTLFALIVTTTVSGMVLFPNTLVGPVGGRFIAALLLGLWALIRIFREFGIHFNLKALQSSFSFNFYTFIYQLLQWVINYFDRILMVFFIALGAIGVYDFAFKCLLVIEFVLNGLHNSFYPRVVSALMSRAEKTSTPEVNRYYHGFISVIMIMICLCILTFPWAITTFVERTDYHESIVYLPYIAVIYVFRAVRLYFAVPFGILKYTKPLPVVYIIVSAIKVIGMIILIQKYLIFGVIISSLVSAAAEIVLLYYASGKKFAFRFNVYKIIIAPMALLALVLTLEPMLGGTYPIALHSFYLVFCAALLWWVYRNEIKLIDPFKLIK